MDPYAIHPDGRLLWCLRRRATDVRCVMVKDSVPVKVVVLQDRDVILTELFQDEELAEYWASAYSARLRELGWFDCPP